MVADIKQVEKLLNKHDIQTVWKTLIATHAKLSYPTKTSEILLSSKDYNQTNIMDEDILEGLSVGEIGILYEFSLAHVDKNARKTSGQYFTPDDVAQYLASLTSQFDDGIWLDPCSGVGNLSYWLVKQQPDPEHFIINNLILTDRDPLALLIAKSILFLHFYKTNKNLYQIMSNKFQQLDFLENNIPKHDYVIVNPPYAQTVENHKFETYKTRDLYAYFLENITKTSKGFISVTPQSFTNSNKFDTLRKLIINKYSNITVMCFDNIPDSIFKGIKYGSTNTNTANSTRAAIIVANNVGKQHHQITPLLRWTSKERSTMFKQIPTQLTDTTFTSDTWLKHYKTLQTFYKTTQQWGSLQNYIVETPTPYSLTIPTTPRYFISATKRKLNRSSFREIFFKDEETRNKIYLYLNSSLPYWWWRLNDGGMTLSKDTIITVPIPVNLTYDKTLDNKLVTSETDNLVSKMNAGKNNENVKHPQKLIMELNETLFGEKVAKNLIKLHSNSDFTQK